MSRYRLLWRGKTNSQVCQIVVDESELADLPAYVRVHRGLIRMCVNRPGFANLKYKGTEVQRVPIGYENKKLRLHPVSTKAQPQEMYKLELE